MSEMRKRFSPSKLNPPIRGGAVRVLHFNHGPELHDQRASARRASTRGKKKATAALKLAIDVHSASGHPGQIFARNAHSRCNRKPATLARTVASRRKIDAVADRLLREPHAGLVDR